MKELEARHLAPYLPYNLQVEYKGKATTLDALDTTGGAFVGENRMVSFVNQRHIKPILRHLSSMTEKESDELEDIIGCNFYIYVSGNGIEIEDIIIDPWGGQSVLRIETLNRIYEWLFAHHFDMFNLIENDLAIEKK